MYALAVYEALHCIQAGQVTVKLPAGGNAALLTELSGLCKMAHPGIIQQDVTTLLSCIPVPQNSGAHSSGLA